MKIAIVHSAFVGVGGAEIVAVNQARYLANGGHQVTIVTTKVDGRAWGNSLSPFRVETIEMPLMARWLGGKRKSWAHLLARLSSVLRGEDVAVAHNYPMSRALVEADVNCRRVWYCHEPRRDLHLQAVNPTICSRIAAGIAPSTDAEDHYARQLRSYNDTDRADALQDIEAARRFDAIGVNSCFTDTLVQRAFARQASEVIYPLMVLSPAVSMRRGLRRNPTEILIHTRLEAPKNVDTALRAVAQILRRPACSMRVNVVGEGTRQSKLVQLAGQLGIQDHVVFHGYLPRADLDRLYELCDIFLLLPIDEPFGMVFPEAMIKGLIVVGPNHGGPNEILQNGQLGITCDAFTPMAVANGIEKVLAMSDSEVIQLRASAIESCRGQFSSNRLGEQLLTLCDPSGRFQ